MRACAQVRSVLQPLYTVGTVDFDASLHHFSATMEFRVGPRHADGFSPLFLSPPLFSIKLVNVWSRSCAVILLVALAVSTCLALPVLDEFFCRVGFVPGSTRFLDSKIRPLFRNGVKRLP